MWELVYRNVEIVEFGEEDLWRLHVGLRFLDIDY